MGSSSLFFVFIIFYLLQYFYGTFFFIDSFIHSFHSNCSNFNFSIQFIFHYTHDRRVFRTAYVSDRMVPFVSHQVIKMALLDRHQYTVKSFLSYLPVEYVKIPKHRKRGGSVREYECVRERKGIVSPLLQNNNATSIQHRTSSCLYHNTVYIRTSPVIKFTFFFVSTSTKYETIFHIVRNMNGGSIAIHKCNRSG